MTTLGISFGATGKRRSAMIVEALRSGRYDVHPELRLGDDGTPRMIDLVPKDQILDEDGGIPAQTAIPLIRMRSFSKVLPDFDPVVSAIAVYEALADETASVQPLHPIEEDEPMPARMRTMFAAYAATETPEMRLVASAAPNVCVMTSPTPWSTPHALVMRHPKTGGFTPLASMEVEPPLAALIAPSVSVIDGGRTMDGTRIETIRATFVHCRAEEVPEPIDALRTLASTPIPGIAA